MDKSLLKYISGKKRLVSDAIRLLFALLWLFGFFPLPISGAEGAAATELPKTYFINKNAPYYIPSDFWEIPPAGGDTIFISSNRTTALKFSSFHGDNNQPLVVINYGGQVNIDDTEQPGAISFVNCSFIKITGSGDPDFRYGFRLQAKTSGLDFSGLSSDCEAAFIKIEDSGFFGIVAKKDYDGNPPDPPPVFANLVIHDCCITNVSEGMYLGETKSPGMEFKKVRIFNNIVMNTGREAIQIANMVEDVEIYNNTLLNGGMEELSCHNKILQIGDNSVAHVYNNIITGAQGSGIVSFGKGNNTFRNNYISSCNGMFIDNRKFTNKDASVVISDNFFTGIDGDKIIENMNELNFIEITGNKWNTDVPFYKNTSGNDNNYRLEKNVNQFLHTHVILESPENGDGRPLGTPPEYENIGAPGDPVSFILFQLAATSGPNGSGNISGAGNYGYGETAILTANPEPGYAFINWTENGEVISTSETFTFFVAKDRSLTANFEPKSYTITAEISPDEGGTVTSAESCRHGETAILTADPETGYTFKHWSEKGAVISTSETFTFVVAKDRSLTARFALATGTNKINASPVHMKIFPNPVKGWLTVSFPADHPDDIFQLKITTMEGKTIMIKNKQTNGKIDVTLIPPGIYAITAKKDNQYYNKIFIKK